MTKNFFNLMLAGLILAACSGNNRLKELSSTVTDLDSLVGDITDIRGEDIGHNNGNKRSKELSCAVTDKDGQVWYITHFRGEDIEHNNGIVTKIGQRQTLEETNMFSGYNNGGNYYSITHYLNASDLVEKVVKKAPYSQTKFTRYYEYSHDRLVKVIEEMSNINDDKAVARTEDELVWEDDDLIDVIHHGESAFDGSPYTTRYHYVYGKEENPLRCFFAFFPAEINIDLFAGSGYYGLGPKHIPVTEEYYTRDGNKLEETRPVTIQLNPNGTVAREEAHGIVYDYSYEKE